MSNESNHFHPVKQGLSYDQTATLVRSIVEPKLQEELFFCKLTFNLIIAATSVAFRGHSLKHISVSKAVCTDLLSRLALDLQAQMELAAGSLVFQALSLTAASYENVMVLCSIADDSVSAQTWIEHTAPNRTPEYITESTRKAVLNLGLICNPFEPYERIYRVLCQYKHVNPLIQREASVISCPDCEKSKAFTFFPKPFEADVRLAKLSLQLSYGLVQLGLRSYIKNQMGQEVDGPLDVLEIICRQQQLNESLDEIELSIDRLFEIGEALRTPKLGDD